MPHGIKSKLKYRLERFLAKGGSSIFVILLIAFILCFLLIVGIRALILAFVGPINDYNTVSSFWDHIWYVFLQMTDPGNMYQDSEATGWIRITTVISGIVGVIILSALIAFITTALDKLLYKFRKGRGIILEEGHTLILGWNERVVDILKELIIANESEKSASVVILSEKDNEEMDDFIVKRIRNSKTTKIITSNGNPSNLNELKRVNASEASSVIILAECSDSASYNEKLLSDTHAVKSLMAMLTCQNGESNIPIITEIFTQQKRDIVSFFEDEKLIAIDSWDIMGKLLVQTSLTSGLEMVYNEILSFDLSEIYYYHSKWNGTTFKQLPYHFKDGIPLGISKEDGTLVLRPEEDYIMEDSDEILILANDDSTIDFNSSPLFQPKDLPYQSKEMEKSTRNILILGWHHVGNIFVEECEDYLRTGSVFDVVVQHPSEELQAHLTRLDQEYSGIKINLIQKNNLSIENLRDLNPYNYDTILILSQDPDEQSADKVDSDTLMILLLLRKIAKELNIVNGQHKTKVISQVLDSDNQDLIIQTDIDDFIISNKLITMILAQLSQNYKIKKLYDDIFQEDGSEIYVKPASLYFDEFPVKESFASILEQATKRNEICLGLRYQNESKNAGKNFGVVLNLPKDSMVTLTEDDFLVVLAEDEL